MPRWRGKSEGARQRAGRWSRRAQYFRRPFPGRRKYGPEARRPRPERRRTKAEWWSRRAQYFRRPFPGRRKYGPEARWPRPERRRTSGGWWSRRAHIPGGIFRRRAVCDRWREGQGRRGAQRAQLSSVQRRAEEAPEEAGEEPTAMEDPSNAATFSAITVASSTLPSASITYRLGIHFT